MQATRRTLMTMVPTLAGIPVFSQGVRAGASTPFAATGLEELGFDPAMAGLITQALADFPAVTGVCVVRHGQIAFEHYRGGYGVDDVVDIRSVTKSVTSTLVGIALERGDLASIDLTLGDLMPDRIPATADPAVADLTLRSFLTMTSGLWWDGHADWQMLIASDDWVETTLSQPIVALPGQQVVYNTGGSHLIGVALATVAGVPLEEYAEEHLFGPLGIQRGDWMRSPQGEVNGGSGLELLPRDMAKLGVLHLQDGAWDGVQVVAESYARKATTQQSDGESITGGSIGVAYGFQWWITDATGYDAYFALGFGGQYVYVVPELDLVVVVAAGFEDGETPYLTSHRPIPERWVIPYLVDPER